MEIVVNEWLPEWLSPIGTDEEHIKAKLFVQKFFGKDDKIIVKYNSEFKNKLLRYPKQFNGYPEHALMLSFFINNVFNNSDKCRLLYQDELLPLPESILSLITKPFDSDLYLFEAAFHSSDKIIITTDERLIAKTKDNGIVRVLHFNDFIAAY